MATDHFNQLVGSDTLLLIIPYIKDLRRPYNLQIEVTNMLLLSKATRRSILCNQTLWRWYAHLIADEDTLSGEEAIKSAMSGENANNQRRSSPLNAHSLSEGIIGVVSSPLHSYWLHVCRVALSKRRLRQQRSFKFSGSCLIRYSDVEDNSASNENREDITLLLDTILDRELHYCDGFYTWPRYIAASRQIAAAATTGAAEQGRQIRFMQYQFVMPTSWLFRGYRDSLISMKADSAADPASHEDNSGSSYSSRTKGKYMATEWKHIKLHILHTSPSRKGTNTTDARTRSEERNWHITTKDQKKQRLDVKSASTTSTSTASSCSSNSNSSSSRNSYSSTSSNNTSSYSSDRSDTVVTISMPYEQLFPFQNNLPSRLLRMSSAFSNLLSSSRGASQKAAAGTEATQSHLATDVLDGADNVTMTAGSSDSDSREECFVATTTHPTLRLAPIVGGAIKRGVRGVLQVGVAIKESITNIEHRYGLGSGGASESRRQNSRRQEVPFILAHLLGSVGVHQPLHVSDGPTAAAAARETSFEDVSEEGEEGDRQAAFILAATKKVKWYTTTILATPHMVGSRGGGGRGGRGTGAAGGTRSCISDKVMVLIAVTQEERSHVRVARYAFVTFSCAANQGNIAHPFFELFRHVHNDYS